MKKKCGGFDRIRTHDLHDCKTIPVQSIALVWGMAEVMGLNPVEASEFFSGLSLQLLYCFITVRIVHLSSAE